MLDQCEVVFARADMIQHLMPQWQRGKRKNKWRVLLFQRLDLAFFPSCETSESQMPQPDFGAQEPDATVDDDYYS